MAIDPVKIPQNVYVEDRIVGPITLRQLIIVLLTGGFSYMLWTGIKTSTGYVDIPLSILAWTPCAIGAAFAFIKIQGISLFRLCLLLVEKMDKPAVRQWAPRRGISINFQFSSTKKDKGRSAPAPVQPHQEKLEELSILLDRGPTTRHPPKAEDEPATPPVDQESTEEPRRPVHPERITASAPQGECGPLDDITPTAKLDAPRPSSADALPLLRDILPPTSHA